jgi:hypothetical protein
MRATEAAVVRWLREGARGGASLAKKMCDDCGLIATGFGFGLSSEGKKQWCVGGAKAHTGVVNAATKKCDDC